MWSQLKTSMVSQLHDVEWLVIKYINMIILIY